MRPRDVAKHRRYIQAQPPWLRFWLVFDVDRDASWDAAEVAGLPTPTFIAINRQNGHGHLAYGLDTPVRLEYWNGRRGPANYLAAIKCAMTARLAADSAYCGFICKNPLHRCWATLWSDHLFSLGELHGWLEDDLHQYHLPPREQLTGVGRRNVETFDHVRNWAYCRVFKHKVDNGTLETWRMACTKEAEAFTAQHTDPLDRSECRGIGRSVSKWTWAKFTPERFAAIQRKRGRGGIAVCAERAARDRRILELIQSGETRDAVAEKLGVSRSTVARVLRAEGVKAISG